MKDKISHWLSGAHPALFSAYAIVAAFSTYFSMYAFRKPFAAATYDAEPTLTILGAVVTYKTVAIMCQVMGYATSKFVGIKVISEMKPDRRAQTIALCMAVAWGSLLLYAVIPRPYNLVALFFNGLPLGMIWGLVFGYLEGRKVSEVLGAGLSLSYIIASGAVKSVGKYLLAWGVPEFWMPFTTAAMFTLPMAFFVFLLAALPPPTAEDERLRTKRAPMQGPERVAFFKRFAPGLIPLTVLYVALTAYRDFRDNFAVEIWAALDYDGQPEILALSELPVAVGVMGGLALLYLVKDNRSALLWVHALMATGTALLGIATAAFQMGWIDPAVWMILLGLGLYLAYVPYGCVLFDRLIAAVGAVGTAGFLIYLTDSAGYFGAVALMLYRDLGAPELSWLDFFISITYATSALCTTLFLISMAYFARRTRDQTTTPASESPERAAA